MNEEIILGALLHDIGKFAQRAGEKLCDSDRGIEATCCPLYNGRYTHTHVLHSGKFIRKLWGDHFPQAELAALFHHRPETCTQRKAALMVTLADRLSSGERQALDDEEETGKPKEARIFSIFSNLTLEDQPAHPLYFPIRALNGDLKNHFPEPSEKMGADEDYGRLWASFMEEIRHLDIYDCPSIFLRQLLSLLEKYTLFIPSAAYKERPDISLFHHLKTTAAITTCLLHLDLQEEELVKILSDLRSQGPHTYLKEESFYLIGGDLSGIQSFIYAVASQGALKGLRGRSIYLQLLAEGIAESLLWELELNPTCLIYCSGGHFYLLAPKNSQTEKVLLNKRSDMNKILINAHKGKINVSLAWQPFSYGDFLGSSFGEVWDKLGTTLAREKRRKIWSILENETDRKNIFGPFEVTGEETACAVCGDEIIDFNKPEPIRPSEKIHCSLCDSFENLAGKAARANFIFTEVGFPQKDNVPLSGYSDVIKAIGFGTDFLERSVETKKEYCLNTTSFLGPGKNYLGFRFLGKHSPLSKEGDLVTLEEMAEASQGISKWGVLRADVDLLGQVFRNGLRGGDRSISRLSMLSHMISLFFSAHVQCLVHQKHFRSGVSLVYSGGDDLFVLGAWSMLPELAKQISHDFRRFTGEALHISVGLFLAPSTGYPVYQAAEAAGKEISLAKHAGRNRFSIFQTPIPWERFKGVEEMKDILKKLLEGGAPRSIFSMLYAGWEEQLLAGKGAIPMFRVWKLLYGLRRLREDHKKLEAELFDLESKLIKDLWIPEFTNVGFRWAEYLTRRKEEHHHV